uniref:5'-nucleotidase n=1 Tax=Candidatus Kentrum sp. TUN TaxID=2126343 RepID=A0A450ZUH0_9GAMM|nr:MAG: 5'/3'-nucleotidase SurE [Candidatus Kentron sp. TUN]
MQVLIIGDAVLYSGTVAAAMEGRFLGLPAIAVSSVAREPAHYESAARAVRLILDHIMYGSLTAVLPTNTILNVNVPDIPYHDIHGLEITQLGHEHKVEGAVAGTDPWGRAIYWVAPVGPGYDAGPGTDFFAVHNNKISITPVQVDLTSQSSLEPLSAWAESVKLE